MSKKISYYELQNVPMSSLQKQYKMTPTQIEHQVRRQMDGAKSEERSKLYESIYSKKE